MKSTFASACRAWQVIAASFIGTGVSLSAYGAPPKLVLNAPSCAQEVENYRRECLRACESNPAKAQCSRSCNDPDKLSPKLAQCEERNKKPAQIRGTDRV